MKVPVGILLLTFGALGVTGCSTVDSRIAGHRTAYASWPPAVQQLVRAGQVAIGFTREQVQVALGSPDYVFGRTSTTGSFEVWSYRDRGPRFSFGVGVGGGSFHHGGGTAYGTGIGVNTGPGYAGEKLRVIFDPSGRVTSVEEVRRGR